MLLLFPSALAARRSSSSLLLLRFFSSGLRPLTEETVLAALSSYSADWARALDFFEWARSAGGFVHTTATFNAAIDILGKHLEFPHAWALLDAMAPAGAPPDRATFRSLFNRLAAARLVPDALRAFARAHDFGLRDPATFHLLVDALCDHRLAPDAEELFLNSTSPPPFPLDTKLHNIFLRGWLKMGWWGKCRDLWDRMGSSGVPRDLHTYSIYMDFLSKSGKPWKSIKLYKEMKKKGMKLDVVAYNTVAKAAGLCDGPEQAIRVLREMIDCGCRPNVVTFNTIIKLLCDAGRIDEGYVFVNKMRKMGCEPDVITYHCFFRNLNRPKEMMDLFERMVGSGCRPRMDTYVMLMKKFGRWGFLRPVFVVWRAMQVHGYSPDAFAYNALIDALVQKGMVDMARKYDEEMLTKGLSAKPRKELGTKGLGVDPDDDALSNVF